MTDTQLTSARAEALINILIHHEAYSELRDLRQPGHLSHSGPPFKTISEPAELNQSPLLYALLTKFIVPLPGLRDVSQDFWQGKCQEIIEEFAKANLSESYDAGYVGIRKTLATAMAALVEGPARGLYSGYPRSEVSRNPESYDTKKPEDVLAAFDDFMQKLIYEDLIERLFDRVTETDKIEDHDSLVQSAHEYMLILIASFLHYILIITPEGQTMLTMMRRANAIVPYTAIRQTLKVGNAATMINGMIRIVLTKMTMNSVTTFIGITNASDAGWNLLQTIISTVVNWDTKDLKRRALEIERMTEGPSRAQLELLESYVEMSHEEHEKCRKMSEVKTEPLVSTVMEEHEGGELNDQQIPLALEYLSIKLSLRDRRQTIGILCSRQPDLFTAAVRECVSAYDPVIRAMHNAVDLSSTVGEVELFLNDLLKFAPGGNGSSRPSVDEFVQLLRKHQRVSHRFMHQVCKNGPELRDWYKEYSKAAIKNFRAKGMQNGSSNGDFGAGKLTSKLEASISSLSEKQKGEIFAELDSYDEYLRKLSASSDSALKLDVVADNIAQEKSKKSSKRSKPNTRESSQHRAGPGPGVFLSRWQAYINETAITPMQKDGPVRSGGDPDVVGAVRGSTSKSMKGLQADAAREADATQAPRCTRTVELLAKRFKDILREVA